MSAGKSAQRSAPRRRLAGLVAGLAVSSALAACGSSSLPAPPQGAPAGIKISRHFTRYSVGEGCVVANNGTYMSVAALLCVHGHLVNP
jgi:hypothetical protein